MATPPTTSTRPARGAELELTVDTLAHGGNGVASDHGDWADGKIICGASTTPLFGPLVSFVLADQAAAERWLARARLVGPATSFGAVHTTAERRGRWGTDAVEPGFIRLSIGVEDPDDLMEDILQAL